jgi:hypothetical protein
MTSRAGSNVGGTSLASLPMEMLQLILEHLCTSDIASLGRAVVALGSEPRLWLTPWLVSVRENELTLKRRDWRLVGAANRSELLTLTEIDVSGRQIGPNLGLAVGRAIHTALALTRLYLGGNALGAAGVAPIVLALATVPRCGVSTLDLSLNELGPAGSVDVARALGTNRSVTTLNLAANGMGDMGAAAVAAMLGANATLAALDIRQNALSCAGRSTLMAALRAARSSALLSLAADCTAAQGSPEATLGFPVVFGFCTRGHLPRNNSAVF